MYLRKFGYSEFVGQDQEWILEGLLLKQRNLIVGRNASGKTRILNVIAGLADYISGRRPLGLGGAYDATFIDGENTIEYSLQLGDEQVLSERVSVNGQPLLVRDRGGEGTIRAEQIDGGSMVRFQTPTSQVAALARQDSIQHPFLRPLHGWATSTRHYRFGTYFGQHSLGMLSSATAPAPDARDQNATVALYKFATKQYGDEYKAAVMADMEAVGYQLTDISVGPPVSMRVQGAPGQVVTLNVQERGLRGVTDQTSMSQGMFRALAIFVHFNLGHFSKAANCLLIDDIGEGLDFERSCLVIDRLRARTDGTDTQLIMTTNDRFVMNRVPLKEWSIVQRVRNRVTVKNYENSKQEFEDFRFTGLSNFNFFEVDVAGGRSN